MVYECGRFINASKSSCSYGYITCIASTIYSMARKSGLFEVLCRARVLLKVASVAFPASYREYKHIEPKRCLISFCRAPKAMKRAVRSIIESTLNWFSNILKVETNCHAHEIEISFPFGMFLAA